MITIDTMNFTPFSAFSGGLFVGIAVILFFVSTGRLAGISSIVNNSFFKKLAITCISFFVKYFSVTVL